MFKNFQKFILFSFLISLFFFLPKTSFACPGVGTAWGCAPYVSLHIPSVNFFQSNTYSVPMLVPSISQTYSDFVGFVVSFDSDSSDDWQYDTSTDCTLITECQNIFSDPLLGLSGGSLVRIFVFPTDSLAIGTPQFNQCYGGVYAMCLYDLIHTQVITVNPDYSLSSESGGRGEVVEDNSVIAQQSQQTSIVGDSYTPFIFISAIFLFLLVIGFMLKYFKSKI